MVLSRTASMPGQGVDTRSVKKVSGIAESAKEYQADGAPYPRSDHLTVVDQAEAAATRWRQTGLRGRRHLGCGPSGSFREQLWKAALAAG